MEASGIIFYMNLMHLIHLLFMVILKQSNLLRMPSDISFELSRSHDPHESCRIRNCGTS